MVRKLSDFAFRVTPGPETGPLGRATYRSYEGPDYRGGQEVGPGTGAYRENIPVGPGTPAPGSFQGAYGPSYPPYPPGVFQGAYPPPTMPADPHAHQYVRHSWHEAHPQARHPSGPGFITQVTGIPEDVTRSEEFANAVMFVALGVLFLFALDAIVHTGAMKRLMR